jgi:hypothetical protein
VSKDVFLNRHVSLLSASMQPRSRSHKFALSTDTPRVNPIHSEIGKLRKEEKAWHVSFSPSSIPGGPFAEKSKLQ